MGELFKYGRLLESSSIVGQYVLCITLLCAVVVHAAEPDAASLLDLPNPLGRKLDWKQREFKVDPYISAAAGLQALRSDRAIPILEKAASDPRRSDVVIILCRMLFAPKPRHEFRRPLLGGPSLPGLSFIEDWPTEPIEIVDGIPFLIVQGYMGAGGQPESAKRYLEYCRHECLWSETAFKPVTVDAKKAALQKLFASAKWNRPLTDNEKKFLAEQIEPPKEKDEQKQ